MSIEGDLRTALLTLGAVTALTGSNATTARIRPYKLDRQDDRTEEHIIIEVDAAPRENDLTGTAGLVAASVTISCRAMTRTAANALAEAVRLNGTDPGTGLAGWGGSATAFDAWLEDSAPTTLLWEDASEKKWNVVDMRFIVQYSEVI